MVFPVVSGPAMTSVAASSRSCLLVIAVPVSSCGRGSGSTSGSPWSVPAVRYPSMTSVSRAPSRPLAAANHRLDRVGTHASPGTFAVIPRASSSDSSTRNSRSISSIASLLMSLDRSVLVSTVSVIDRISRSKASVPPSGHLLMRGTATSCIVPR